MPYDAITEAQVADTQVIDAQVIDAQVVESVQDFQCADGTACHQSALIASLQQQLQLLQAQARTDALTGLYNFRFFSETLALEMERARRSFQPLALVLLDIDHFKAFNDRWGHEPGNQALVHVANIIMQASRKLDYVCRYGGEEFALIMPNTDLRQAVAAAQRLCTLLDASPLVLEGNSVQVTASLGVDAFHGVLGESPDVFVNRTDQWLYAAKAAGRQQVAHPPLVEEPVSPTQLSHEEKADLFALFQDGDDAPGGSKPS